MVMSPKSEIYGLFWSAVKVGMRSKILLYCSINLMVLLMAGCWWSQMLEIVEQCCAAVAKQLKCQGITNHFAAKKGNALRHQEVIYTMATLMDNLMLLVLWETGIWKE